MKSKEQFLATLPESMRTGAEVGIAWAEENGTMVTPQEAAEYFGVSLNTIRAWAQAGKLDYSQPGGPRGKIFISLRPGIKSLQGTNL